jgi:hypothetical protein
MKRSVGTVFVVGWLTIVALSCAASARSSDGQVIDKNSPVWAKLAVINTGRPVPDRNTLDRFEVAFARFKRHCTDTDERLGDYLVAGHKQLTDRGRRNTSLLDLTEAVAKMLDTAKASGGVPKMQSCAEPVALLVTALLATPTTNPTAQTQSTMKVGGVYCVSQAAMEEHLKATADADVDRVRDILSVRKICDYAQAPVLVSVLQSPATVKWAKVKLSSSDGASRKGSKVVLPKDLVVWVRKSSLQ